MKSEPHRGEKWAATLQQIILIFSESFLFSQSFICATIVIALAIVFNHDHLNCKLAAS